LIGGWTKGVRILSSGEETPQSLPGFEGAAGAVAFSHDGRLAAGFCGIADAGGPVIRIWELSTGREIKVLHSDQVLLSNSLQFTPDGNLLSDGESGLTRFDTATGGSSLLYQGRIPRFSASRDAGTILMLEQPKASDPFGHAVLFEPESGSVRYLDEFGEDVSAVALDPQGAFAVTGDNDGEIRVGRLTGEKPHLLIGHEAQISSLAIDPQGRWIASGDRDGTLRLWPMPDLSKPPLHTLPHDELIAKLKTLTNLRVVRDPESAAGWKLTHDPFPGWETVPTW